MVRAIHLPRSNRWRYHSAWKVSTRLDPTAAHLEGPGRALLRLKTLHPRRIMRIKPASFRCERERERERERVRKKERKKERKKDREEDRERDAQTVSKIARPWEENPHLLTSLGNTMSQK